MSIYRVSSNPARQNDRDAMIMSEKAPSAAALKLELPPVGTLARMNYVANIILCQALIYPLAVPLAEGLVEGIVLGTAGVIAVGIAMRMEYKSLISYSKTMYALKYGNGRLSGLQFLADKIKGKNSAYYGMRRAFKDYFGPEEWKKKFGKLPFYYWTE